jgi:eukaryotic-like serine/threonine-protein kinase
MQPTETFPLGSQGPRNPGEPLAKGTTVGRYVVLERIGAGGMGVVYAAYDPELDRKVALKLLRPDRAGAAGEAALRLQREAQAIARLSDPHVVAVYDAGTLGDQVFVAMELMEGRTLRQWLAEEKRSWREIVDVFAAAGRGLAAAHTAGLVHRDFKPDNVLLGTDGRIKVADFGLARPVGDADPGGGEAALMESPGSRGLLAIPLTEWGVAMGTPAYMAPEQLRGERADARSDQFSFCVALWEALYGQKPFTGEGLREMLDAERRGAIVEPPAGTGVPARILPILRRGLAGSPEARYPGMAELLQELERDRSDVRRRWLAAAAVVLVTGAIFAGLGYFQARRERLCGGSEERLAGVWDAQVKGKTRAAFLATRSPLAAAAWRAVEERLDRWSRDWTAQHRQACEATRVRGEQSEDLLDRRMFCLDQRLRETGAVTALLAHADTRVMEKSLKALGELEPLGDCANRAALAEKVPPPREKAVRDRVKQLQARISEARTLQAAGRVPQALALALEVDRQAAGVPYKPLQANAALLVGDLLENAGKFQESEENVYRAIWAGEEGRDDLLKARAWKKLVYTVGYRESRYAEAHRLARHAEAALVRAGGEASWEAALADGEASIYQLEGRYDEALRGFERALEISRRLPGSAVYNTLNNMANVYYEKGDYARAFQSYRDALQEVEALKGALHPDSAALRFNIGDVLTKMGRFDEAEPYLQQALERREKLFGPEHPDVAESLQGLAELWEEQGKHEKARLDLERALDIYVRQRASATVPWAMAEGALADCLRAEGHYDQAMRHLHAGLDSLELRLGRDHPYVASLLVILGKIELDRGKPVEALAPLERATTLYAKEGEPSWRADARFGLARALWQSGRDRERALSLGRQARADYFAIGEPEKAQLREVDHWLARNGGRSPRG